MNFKGILVFSMAMIISGTIGIFVKYIDLNSIDIVFFRCLIGASVLFIYVSLFKFSSFKELFKNGLFFTILSGIILVFNWVFLFASLKNSSISVAITIYYLAPIFVMIYGITILREPLKAIKVIIIFLAFIGAVFVSGVGSSNINSNLAGVLYAIIAAILYATLIIIAKKMPNIEPSVIVLFQMTIGAIILFFFTKFSLSEIITIRYELLIAIGIVHTALMYILFFSGIKNSSLESVALIGFLDPLVAVLLDKFLLESKLYTLQWIGVFLIFFAILLKILIEIKNISK